MRDADERERNLAFVRGSENTHTEVLNRSVGRLLRDLSKKYQTDDEKKAGFDLGDLGFTGADGSEATVKAPQAIIDFLSAIRLDVTPERLIAVTTFVVKIVTEPPNPLDKVTFLDSAGVEQTLVMPLSEVLATVYIALTDRDVYEDKTDAACKLRRLSLFHELEALIKKAVCHHGDRHDIVMTLNHVYPGVALIEDLTSFLIALLREQIDSMLQTHFPEASESLKRAWLINDEMPEALRIMLANTEIQASLKKHLEDQCKAHGINPEAAMIRNAIAQSVAEVANLPCDGNSAFLSDVRYLLHECPAEPEPSLRNPWLSSLQTWIKAPTTAFNDDDKKFLAVVVQIERLAQKIKRYGLMMVTNGDITEEQLNKLQAFVKMVYEYPRAEDRSGVFSRFEAHKAECKIFNTALSHLLNDKQLQFIQNFFALFYDKTVDYRLKSNLAAHLAQDAFVDKIKLKNIEIRRYFQPKVEGTTTTLEIDPYLINRVFLHALCVPIAEWTDTFSKTLDPVLSYVNRNLGVTDAAALGKALKETSYPPRLRDALALLLAEYRAYQATATAEVRHNPTVLTHERLVKLLQDSDTLFHKACKYGFVATVQRMLADGAVDINAENRDGLTALRVAAARGHTDVVRLLLADPHVGVNTPDREEGYTALHLAAAKGHTDVVRLLLADPRVEVNTPSSAGMTALHFAASFGNAEVVQLLLADPRVEVTVNAPNNRGVTALHFAAARGHVEVLRLLMDNPRVDVNATDSYGNTALHVAAARDHAEMVQLLLDKEGVKVNATNSAGDTALDLAETRGHGAVISLLEEDSRTLDSSGNNQLMLAAREGDTELVRKILEKGRVGINAKNHDGQTALHLAARFGHANVVRLLLNTDGVDVNAYDNSGDTPLHFAARNGHIDMVRLLLETASIDVNACDRWHGMTTALHLAASFGHANVVRLLLETDGVNVNARDSRGDTALQLAANNHHANVVSLLKEDGRALDHFGNNQLVLAAREGDTELVRKILEKGRVDINAKDRGRYTALQLAASKGDIDVVRLLLETEGVNVNARDYWWGYTALQLAVENGHIEVAELIIEKSPPNLQRPFREILTYINTRRGDVRPYRHFWGSLFCGVERATKLRAAINLLDPQLWNGKTRVLGGHRALAHGELARVYQHCLSEIKSSSPSPSGALR